jgi:hypothetical protein
MLRERGTVLSNQQDKQRRSNRKIFAGHYSQNREVQSAEIIIEENLDIIMQRKLVLTETEMLKDLPEGLMVVLFLSLIISI